MKQVTKHTLIAEIIGRQYVRNKRQNRSSRQFVKLADKSAIFYSDSRFDGAWGLASIPMVYSQSASRDSSRGFDRGSESRIIEANLHCWTGGTGKEG
jgi:hypothetical protein